MPAGAYSEQFTCLLPFDDLMHPAVTPSSLGKPRTLGALVGFGWAVFGAVRSTVSAGVGGVFSLSHPPSDKATSNDFSRSCIHLPNNGKTIALTSVDVEENKLWLVVFDRDLRLRPDDKGFVLYFPDAELSDCNTGAAVKSAKGAPCNSLLVLEANRLEGLSK